MVKEIIKQGWVKVYNLIQREIAYTTQIDSTDQYIPYFDHSDVFPVELNNLVTGSPTATSCISTLTDFITGEGFNQGEKLEQKKLNVQGLTFEQFHAIQAGSLAQFWGVATLVKYNNVGQITELTDLPFSNCRLGVPDSKGVISKIKYNPYFGTALYKRSDTIEYDVYNPDHAVEQALKQGSKFKGQVAWFGIRDKKHPFYPVPDYYTAKHWMRVEKNAGIYFDENLENGFLNSAIIKLFGDPNDPSGLKDSDGNDIPKGKAFNTEMTQNFSGAKRVAKIMAFWANNKDEFPTVEAFPSNAGADMYRVQDDHATKKITIATKVPSILANINEGVSLGGDGNTIRAAVKLMQQRVKRMQNILLAYYKELLSRMVVPVTEAMTIVPYNPFPELESIDPQIWAEMSTEERRKWIQDHTEIEIQIELEDKTTQNKENNTGTTKSPETLAAQAELRGSVGGVNGVLSVQQGVVSGATTVESGLSILTIIYGFTATEARQLLGQPEVETPLQPIQQEAQNKVLNLHFDSYPAKAKENVKRSLEWQEKMGIKCSKTSGLTLSQAILDGVPFGPKDIGRLSRYLSKNIIHKDKTYDESCEAVLYDAWGGVDMMVWANEKLKELKG